MFSLEVQQAQQMILSFPLPLPIPEDFQYLSLFYDLKREAALLCSVFLLGVWEHTFLPILPSNPLPTPSQTSLQMASRVPPSPPPSAVNPFSPDEPNWGGSPMQTYFSHVVSLPEPSPFLPETFHTRPWGLFLLSHSPFGTSLSIFMHPESAPVRLKGDVPAQD